MYSNRTPIVAVIPTPLLAALLTCACAVALPVGSARAQEVTTAEADAAFEEGRRLFEQGRFYEACQKFELSMQLDPSPGTLLNLGNCYEPQGQLLRALATFERALADGEKSEDPRRRKIWTAAARERIAALSGRIPVLVLGDVPAGGEVRLDGKVVDDPNQPMRIDPGRHLLRVSAPGKKTFVRDFTIEQGRRLELLLPEPPPLPVVEAVPEPPPPATQAPLTPPPAESPGDSSRFGVWPWVAGGAGAALIGASLVTGLMASSEAERLESECEGKICLDPSLESAHESASTLALTTDVLWVTGVVALGVGATLFVLDLPSSERSATVAAGCFSAGCGLRASGSF